MTVIGLDDTDSRTLGMCTTYLATLVAEAIEANGGTIERLLLIRLNPAVEHKTRGNAALAIHTDFPAGQAFELARAELERWAVIDDDRTSPGLVVAPGSADTVPTAVTQFARDAVRDFHTVEAAVETVAHSGFLAQGWHGGRGQIGALAAVGAWAAFDSWTYEHISYREFYRCGTPREVDIDSVFESADAGYPTAWDTVDHGEGEAVCVPNAPGPILHGIRGDDLTVVREVAAGIESEPVDREATFLTNQGTDMHLQSGTVADLRDGHAYRVTGTVESEPETRRGGHVFFTVSDDETTLPVAAFEPTKRFRNRVRSLRVGDELTLCGEVSDGTLKLEKFAVRDLVETEATTPVCPECERTMKSAGREQGYRCRDCGTDAPGKVETDIERDLELGWYEVPPCARRHIAKPLVRGGFDAVTHPER
ncbi:DUF1743 domain-containing protein [Haloferax namakaokahaiae]|uniref:tRNA(Ile2) 2-agmatinylcytidine synthetase TiaS n=1 Tax=Haloferax namakaokahaiae TaxID=1748331 RepID=A0ABD5ZHI3_9EURY